MTREEAKRFGHCILAVADANTDKDAIEFTKIALEALEQEPKTGHWELGVDFGNVAHYYCSECRQKRNWHTPYCPNCGAKMESEVRNDKSN